jgi:molecular chaperone DnaK (HSP70)
MSSVPEREPIVGIDLGTTNSLVAWYEPGVGARILVDEHGRDMTPSVVRYGAGGVEAVGHEASEPAAGDSIVVRSVKRLMGRSKADAAGDLAYFAYEVVEGANATARVRVPTGTVTPQEVSAAILRHLKAVAERALGREVRKAVVTVPAYFDDAQRQATRDAGRLAGLEVVRIVNEPTAAALAYGLGRLPPGADAKTIAVYDLGGGTFDVSILRLTPAEREGETAFFQVLSTAGDTHLGGDDIDHLIVDAMAADLASRGASPPTDPEKQSLTREAERVKVALSDAEQARSAFEACGVRVERDFTRAWLEGVFGPLIERTIAACRRAVADAKVQPGEISAAVLVGGSTRIPAVRRDVAAFFGVEPYTAINPDEAVALGAAVQAGVLAGSASGTLLLDVIPLSLGIETAGGAAAKIITRNSAVPARAREMFSTQVDKQTAVTLHIVQGEREMAADCRSLGTFHLRGIPPMPVGLPQIEVEFAVDASGILNVSAHERRSGRRAHLQVVPNHGLSREEVERIEQESFTHAREDMTRHRVVDLVVNSKLDLKWIGDRHAKHGHLLDEASRASLAAAMDDLRGFVERGQADWKAVDPNAMHRAKDRLDKASVRLQEISIAQSLRRDGELGNGAR